MAKNITIPTRELAAVAKWAHEDPGKTSINTLLFARGEYVATDGHRLVRVPCETNGLAFAVDRSHLLAACAAQGAIRDMDQITLEPDGKAHVKLGIAFGVSLLVPFRDPAAHPEIESIEQVMPTKKDLPSLDGYILDPRYLAAIAEVNAANAPNSTRGVKVVAWSGDRLGAMLLENCNGVRFVVMPMRCM